jgi:toxin ParE1/3/4
VRTRYKVLVTRHAEEDIVSIWHYIASDSKERANLFIAEIEERLPTLRNFPGRCPVIAESELLGIEYRQMIIGNYRIILRIERETVFIMRIVHGARLLEL